MSTGTVTFVWVTFVLGTFGHLSISAITQLLLTPLRTTFKVKGRFLGLPLLNSICQDDICPCNICPGDICPYINILPKFGPNFLDQHFVRPKPLGYKFIWTQNYLRPKILLGSNIFWTKNHLGSKILFKQKFFLTQHFWDQNFLLTKIFWAQTFWTQNFLAPKFLLDLSGWFFMIQPKYNIQNHTIFLGFDSIEINLACPFSM